MALHPLAGELRGGKHSMCAGRHLARFPALEFGAATHLLRGIALLGLASLDLCLDSGR